MLLAHFDVLTTQPSVLLTTTVPHYHAAPPARTGLAAASVELLLYPLCLFCARYYRTGLALGHNSSLFVMCPVRC
jgi:hypothetical protein